jgi:hypothetical protein
VNFDYFLSERETRKRKKIKWQRRPEMIDKQEATTKEALIKRKRAKTSEAVKMSSGGRATGSNPTPNFAFF